MKTTFICWLVGFVGSFLSVFEPFITGHRNVGWGIIQILILSVYFIRLPFTYLINCHETKTTILNFNWISALFWCISKPIWKAREIKPTGRSSTSNKGIIRILKYIFYAKSWKRIATAATY